MTFYTFINYFRKLFEFFCVLTFSYNVKHSLVVIPRKMVLLKFENIRRDKIMEI